MKNTKIILCLISTLIGTSGCRGGASTPAPSPSPAPTIQSLKFNPLNALTAGSLTQPTLIETFSDGSTLQVAASATVLTTSASSAQVAIDVNNNVLGKLVGNYNLTATVGSVSDNLQISVIPGSPTHILKVSGDNQVGTVSGALTSPVSVKVQDNFGNPTPGVLVLFSALSGGSGTFTPASVSTQADGTALSNFRLGTVSGSQPFQAAVSVAPSVLVAFSSTANADVVNRIAFVTQPSATSVAGVSFTTSPVIGVQDRFGNNVSNLNSTVALKPFLDSACTLPGSGTLSTSNATLGVGTGTVSINNLSYTRAETIYIQAAIVGLTSVCSSNVVVSSSSPVRLVKMFGDAQTGAVAQALPQSLQVKALDSFNNIVTNVQISFSPLTGGGTFNPTTAQTDSTGQASSVLTMGQTAGNQSFQATSLALPAGSQTVIFSETATPSAPTKLLYGTAPSTIDYATIPFSIQPVIQLQDVFNNLVPTSETVQILAYSNSTCSIQPQSVLGGTTSLTSATGQFSFTNISYGNQGGEVIYLVATDGVRTSSCLGPINVIRSLTIQTPSNVTLVGGEQIDFSVLVSGGKGGYQYSVSSNLGSTITLGGLYVAAVNTTGIVATDTILVKDANNTIHIQLVNVYPSLALTQSNVIAPRTGTVNVSGYVQGGIPPYTYSVTGNSSGASLNSPNYQAGNNLATDQITISDSKNHSVVLNIAVSDYSPSGIMTSTDRALVTVNQDLTHGLVVQSAAVPLLSSSLIVNNSVATTGIQALSPSNTPLVPSGAGASASVSSVVAFNALATPFVANISLLFSSPSYSTQACSVLSPYSAVSCNVATGNIALQDTDLSSNPSIPINIKIDASNGGPFDQKSVAVQTQGLLVKQLMKLNAGSDDAVSHMVNVGPKMYIIASLGGLQKLFEYDIQFSGLRQISNLNPGNSDNISSLTPFQQSVFFVATNASGNSKVFQYNYANQTLVQITDINSGAPDAPQNLVIANNRLYFSALSGGLAKLFEYNPSVANVVNQISNICSGCSDAPGVPVVIGNVVYFSASYDSLNDTKLYSYDSAGAVLKQVSNTSFNIASNSSDSPTLLTPAGTQLFFIAKNYAGKLKLYDFDTVAQSLSIISNTANSSTTDDIDMSYSGSTASNAMIYVNNKLLFVAKAQGVNKLFQYDLSSQSLTQVSNINAGTDDFAGSLLNSLNMTAQGNSVYFVALYQGVNKLFSLNTANGSLAQVASSSGSPITADVNLLTTDPTNFNNQSLMAQMNGSIYYRGSNATGQNKLYQANSSSGVQTVTEVSNLVSSGTDEIFSMTTVGSKLFFVGAKDLSGSKKLFMLCDKADPTCM